MIGVEVSDPFLPEQLNPALPAQASWYVQRITVTVDIVVADAIDAAKELFDKANDIAMRIATSEPF